jgi:hypothetical protein
MTIVGYIARFVDNINRGRPPFDFSPIVGPDAISRRDWARAEAVLELERLDRLRRGWKE